MKVLITEWRKCWKLFSVQAATVCAILPEVYEHVDVVQDYVEPTIFHHIQAGLGVLVIVARLVNQK